MADYYPLLSRAVAALAGKPDSDRQAVYGRAREALERQLRGFEPALPEADIRAELASLEATIARIEVETPSFSTPSFTLPLDVVEPVLPGASRPTADVLVKEAAASTAPPDMTDLSPAGNTADVGPNDLPQEAPEPEETPEPQEAPELQEAPVQATLRPRMPSRRESDGKKSPLALFALVAVVAMLGMGLLALNKRETATSPTAPPVVLAPESATDASKTEGRLAGSDAARLSEPKEASTPAAPTTKPAEDSRAAAPTAETRPASPAVPATFSRAFMVLEIQSGSPNQFEGRSIWTFAPDAGLKGQKSLRAAIEFPAANFAIDFSVGRNTDPALNASHTVMVIFDPKNGIENIREMSAVEWRERENQTGAVLAGIIVPVQDNVFMIGLDKTEAAQTRNLDLLRTQKWMVFEIRLTNGRRGAILVEKGANGEKAINEALAEWK